MDEENIETQTPDNNGEGVQPETTPIIKNAMEAAERLERANAKKEEILDREEALMARQALSGRAEAGQPNQKKLSEEEKKQQEAENFFAGTDLEKAIKEANE